MTVCSNTPTELKNTVEVVSLQQVDRLIESVSSVTWCALYRWYFAMISMSGAFSVTFSVIFAYVADVTDERERSTAYGLVSAATECFYF